MEGSHSGRVRRLGKAVSGNPDQEFESPTLRTEKLPLHIRYTDPMTEEKPQSKRDWRKTTMSRISALIAQADSKIEKKVKYKAPSNPAGVFVWYRDGMIVTGETYKKHLRLSFAKGPDLKDPKGLINTYRAIVIHEGDTLNEKAFKDLIKAAVTENQKRKSAKPRKKS